MTNSCEPVSTFDKRPFCLDNLSYGILSGLEVSNIRPISLYKVISSGSISIKSHERYVKFLDYISELRNKFFTCNQNVLYNDVKHQILFVRFQHNLWDVIQEVPYCI